MMHRLNVRCCCQPQKILGTIEVPYLMPEVILRVPPIRRRQYFDPITQSVEFAESSAAEKVQIKPIFDADTGLRELAVYSEDRPIEFWRKFPSFIEAIIKEEQK